MLFGLVGVRGSCGERVSEWSGLVFLWFFLVLVHCYFSSEYYRMRWRVRIIVLSFSISIVHRSFVELAVMAHVCFFIDTMHALN